MKNEMKNLMKNKMKNKKKNLMKNKMKNKTKYWIKNKIKNKVVISALLTVCAASPINTIGENLPEERSSLIMKIEFACDQVCK